jgi:hypothetical protein
MTSTADELVQAYREKLLREPARIQDAMENREGGVILKLFRSGIKHENERVTDQLHILDWSHLPEEQQKGFLTCYLAVRRILKGEEP